MKLFQFQNGGNTRFVYQSKPEQQDYSEILAAAKECRDEIIAELGALNREVYSNPEERFNERLLNGEKIKLSTGWVVNLGGTFPDDAYGTDKFQPNGSIYMRRTIDADPVAETPRVRWQVVKTFRNPANLKVVRNGEMAVRAKNDEKNTIKKVVEKVPGLLNDNVVVYKPDETVKRTRGEIDAEKIIPKIEELREDVVEDIQEIYEDSTEMLNEEAQAELQQINNNINETLGNYTIKPGDTISDIVSFCKKDGKSPNWKDVYEVNKGHLRSKNNPDLIYPGEKLKLPDGYTLNRDALDEKQLKNLNDWYGAKKALEVRARQTKIDQANANTASKTSPVAKPGVSKTKPSSSADNLTGNNEVVKQITPEDVSMSFNEANTEASSDEQVKTAEDYFFNEEHKKEWKKEDYDKAGEQLGLTPQIFDIFTNLDELSGDETIEQLNQRKSTLDNISKEVSGLKERYPNLIEKSERFKEKFRTFDELLTKELSKIDKATQKLQQEAAQNRETPSNIEGLALMFKNPAELENFIKVLQGGLLPYPHQAGPDEVIPFFYNKKDPTDIYFKKSDGSTPVVFYATALKAFSPFQNGSGRLQLCNYLNNVVPQLRNNTSLWQQEK